MCCAWTGTKLQRHATIKQRATKTLEPPQTEKYGFTGFLHITIDVNS